MATDVQVRRYLSLDAVLATLRDGKLRLSLIDYLRRKYDRFEGSVPKAVIDSQVPALSAANAMMYQQVAPHFPGMSGPRPLQVHDRWWFIEQLRLAKTRSAHVVCWSAGHESEGMWRLYCNDESKPGLGVGIQTTLGRLEASVAHHDLWISPVNYRYYHEIDPKVFDDEMDPFFHKRKGFEHEHEVRLLLFNFAHYVAIRPDALTHDLPPAPPADLLDFHYLDWSPAGVIERITISPYADDTYEKKVTDSIAAIEPGLLPLIERSVLDERRYKPLF